MPRCDHAADASICSRRPRRCDGCAYRRRRRRLDRDRVQASRLRSPLRLAGRRRVHVHPRQPRTRAAPSRSRSRPNLAWLESEARRPTSAEGHGDADLRVAWTWPCDGDALKSGASRQLVPPRCRPRGLFARVDGGRRRVPESLPRAAKSGYSVTRYCSRRDVWVRRLRRQHHGLTPPKGAANVRASTAGLEFVRPTVAENAHTMWPCPKVDTWLSRTSCATPPRIRRAREDSRLDAERADRAPVSL